MNHFSMLAAVLSLLVAVQPAAAAEVALELSSPAAAVESPSAAGPSLEVSASMGLLAPASLQAAAAVAPAAPAAAIAARSASAAEASAVVAGPAGSVSPRLDLYFDRARRGSDTGEAVAGRAGAGVPALSAARARAAKAPLPVPAPATAPSRPRLQGLKRWAAAAATLLALAFTGCGSGTDNPAADAGADGGTPASWYLTYDDGHPLAVDESYEPDGVVAENDVLSQINSYRESLGLSDVAMLPPASDVARANSVHMDLHGFTTLQNPEGDFPTDRAAKNDVYFTRLFENVMYGASYDKASAVVDAMKLDPNWTTLLQDPGFQYVGIGYHRDPQAGAVNYWTVDFIQR